MGLKRFWQTVGAVAYLTQELEELSGLDAVFETAPGVDVCSVHRKWEIGGIPLEDNCVFLLSGSLFLSGFNQLIAYGVYDHPDDPAHAPRIGAYWKTEMMKWEPGERYQAHMLSPARQN